MGLFNTFKKEKEKKGNKDNAKVSNQSNLVNEIPFNEPTPIEKRIEGEAPTCDGLYPHEVLVLSYAPQYYTSGNNFPQFWWYKYGIQNVQEVLTSLMERGYTGIGTITDTVMKETIPSIKEELKKHDLKTTGKKANLVQRLVENVPEQELSKIYKKCPYVLTEKGEKIVETYEWIPYIHAHNIEDLNIWNLTQMMQASKNKRYRDCIWGYLNKRSLEHAKNGDYGLYRNCRFEMAKFLEEEGKLEHAFELLCEVCVYDLNFTENNCNTNSIYIDIIAEFYFPYERAINKLAPGILDLIKKYQLKLGWDIDTLTDKMKGIIPEISVPFRIFTADECIDIILYELDDDKAAVEQIYKCAEKRFKKKYKIK